MTRAKFRSSMVLVAALGCGDPVTPKTVCCDGNPKPTSFALQFFAGNGQSGVPGTVLADSIVVRVITTTGTPVSGIHVRFASLAPGAVVSPLTTNTRADGTAKANWQLGLEPGVQTATAAVDQITSPLVFTAFAVAPAAGARLRSSAISAPAPRRSP